MTAVHSSTFFIKDRRIYQTEIGRNSSSSDSEKWDLKYGEDSGACRRTERLTEKSLPKFCCFVDFLVTSGDFVSLTINLLLLLLLSLSLLFSSLTYRVR